MSNKSSSRFAGQLSSLAGRQPTEEKEPQKPVAQPELTQKAAKAVSSDDDTLETFSSHMLKGTKRRLKMAAAKEGRKQYEVVGELVEAWLAKYHPEV